MFQASTGSRVGEAAAMDFKDIDLYAGQAVIGYHLQWDRSKDGKTKLLKGTKGGASRVVYLTQECRKFLQSLKGLQSKGKVFPGAAGVWLAYRTITKCL